jgi:hypothetical protein
MPDDENKITQEIANKILKCLDLSDRDRVKGENLLYEAGLISIKNPPENPNSIDPEKEKTANLVLENFGISGNNKMPNENIEITEKQRDVLLANMPSSFTMETINLIRKYWEKVKLIIEEDPLEIARKIERILVENGISRNSFEEAREINAFFGKMVDNYEKAIFQRDEEIKKLKEFKEGKINDQICART